MTKPGLLIVFSGPSGVGKDTLLQRFLPSREDCVLSVSATTRPPRPGEQDGVQYHFMSREAFQALAERGEMLEYAHYGDNFYGTPKACVDNALAEGKNVILEIEVQGAMQIRELRPDAVFVFVMPPSWEVLRRRLENRGTEDSEALAKRLAAAKAELALACEYDYVIINDNLDRCSQDLDAVITAAGYSAHHMKQWIEEVASHA